MPALDSRPILIFPCNGTGLEAIDCLGDSYHCVGFVDDTPEKQKLERLGQPVRDRTALAQYADANVLAVPGSATSYRDRRALIEGLGVDAKRYASVIHPSASVSPHASIGHNVLLMAGVVITSNAVIGNHVCVLPNSVIHHDTSVADWTLIGSNVTIAGGVVVGENCYVGSGSRIMNDIEIGAGALVGLGSNVIRDVRPGAVIAGNPARQIRAS